MLGTRWVASYRTVNTVLKSYTSLAKHFESVFSDPKRKHEHATFKGLHSKLTSVEFLTDLCLMNDILCEFCYLSEALQKRDMNIVLADKKLVQAIRCIQCMIDKPGTLLTTALEAASVGEYQEVQLHSNSRMKRINIPQLVMSVVNNLKNRIITDESLLKQVTILIPQGY